MVKQTSSMMDLRSVVYHGSLTHQEIDWLRQSLDALCENAPCHINAIIRSQIKQALTKFIEPESIEEPELTNRFIKTIKFQY